MTPSDYSHVFISTEQTGTGIEQTLAHGLSSTPSQVIGFVTGGPKISSPFSIILGSHTATDIKITVSLGIKYRVYAIV